MFKRFLPPACALILSAGASYAATIGSFTFADNAFADNASTSLTTGGTRGPAVSPASAADGDFSTASNLNDSFVEIFFTDNILVNGAGADLVIFTNTNNNVIRLTAAASTNAPFVTGSSTFIPVGATGNTSGFSLSAASIDLSDLGFADGAEITDGLFLSRGGVFTTVWDVGALNSRDVPGPNPVPLPAGLPLLLLALGVLKVFRRA